MSFASLIDTCLKADGVCSLMSGEVMGFSMLTYTLDTEAEYWGLIVYLVFSLQIIFFFFFLADPRHMEFPGHEPDPSCRYSRP